MKVYKLTNQDNKTKNNTIWGENVTHKTNGEEELCGPGWLHFYYSPELAALLNPIHAQIINPKLWEAEANGKILDDQQHDERIFLSDLCHLANYLPIHSIFYYNKLLLHNRLQT